MSDAESVTVKTLILPNYSFGMFWLERHGIKRGGSGDGTAIRSRYVPFMEEHEGRPLDIDIAEFVRWVEERGHGGKQMTHEEVRKAVERLPDVLGYSLSELGFADRDELLAAISTIEKGRVRAKAGPREHISVWDKRFIALLLDQDISFSHGDIILVPYFCDRSER